MSTIADMLLRLRNRGITPTGFIDAGAHFGETNETIRSVFPSSRVVSFEANPYCEPELKRRGIEHYICLLGDRTQGGVKFYLDPNNAVSNGCSIFKEKSVFFENPYIIELPMYRLDEIVSPDAGMEFLKMDVQGAEISVLEGATKLLPSIRWVYLEVSFISYNDGAPLFEEVFDYLRGKGYRIADIVDPTWVDNQLIQYNFLFERV